MKEIVAPPAGAWIETMSSFRAFANFKSRPPRARGLKLVGGLSSLAVGFGRAPRGRVD